MYKLRTVRIRTKNFTAQPLKKAILVPFKAVCRLGSRTATKDVFPGVLRSEKIIECNTVMSVDNSRDKLRMKQCFKEGGVQQANMYHGVFQPDAIKRHFGISKTAEYQLVGKAICGFQGKGMVLIENDEELANFCKTHTPQNFFIELFYNYGREYRLHATRERVFMSWRKLRKADAQERWFFNSHNCNWVGESHELFDKPKNWEELCKQACKSITATGLDIGAVDIRISSKDPSQYIVCEVNSAPALGDEGVEKYREEIKRVLMNKYKNE